MAEESRWVRRSILSAFGTNMVFFWGDTGSPGVGLARGA